MLQQGLTANKVSKANMLVSVGAYPTPRRPEIIVQSHSKKEDFSIFWKLISQKKTKRVVLNSIWVAE
jgi:hypothetical protein